MARILQELPAISPEYKILLLPDQPTPLPVKTHVSDPVPFVIYSSKNKQPGSSFPFDEESAARTGLFIEPGHSLMDRFLLG